MTNLEDLLNWIEKEYLKQRCTLPYPEDQEEDAEEAEKILPSIY